MYGDQLDLITEYRYFKEQGLVLATVLDAAAASPVTPGLRLLAGTGRDTAALVRGYELEEALAADINAAFRHRQARIGSYLPLRMTTPGGDDRDAAEREVQILIQYLDPEDAHHPLALFNAHAVAGGGGGGVLVTICESGIEGLEPGASSMIGPEDDWTGRLPRKLLQEIDGAIAAVRASRTPSLESFILPEGAFSAFFDPVRQPVRLLIAGPGQRIAPLMHTAGKLGWDVRTTCYNPPAANPEFRQEDENHLFCLPEDLPKHLDLDALDAVVIMTSDPRLGQRYLVQFARSRVPYLGLPDQAGGRKVFLESLGDDRQILEDRLYLPMGLELGGADAAAAALAITAEIHAVLHHRSGGLPAADEGFSPPRAGHNPATLYGLVMAAGGSTRFGGIKQLVELDGKSLLKRAVGNITALLGQRVKVVLGLKALKLQRELAGFEVDVVVNETWQSGLSTSLQTGIGALPEACDGVLVVFCDQPLIRRQHLQALIDLWQKDSSKIIVSTYAGIQGVPVIFPRRFFPEFPALRGDKGAKPILERHPADVIELPLPEAETDVDTQADLLAILARDSTQEQ